MPSVQGGTRGVLRCGTQTIADIQVTLHQAEGGALKPVGFAVTSADGSFALLQPGAAGPLFLPEGEYRCCLESAGAPVQFSRKFSKPETTPIRVIYRSDQDALLIEGPPPTMR